jgi:hypothetical protein
MGGLGGEHPSHVQFAGYEALVCLFIGVLTGWVFGLKIPALISTGRWIWILPAIVVFPDMVREVSRSQSIPWLPEYFFATPGNEGLGVYLLTLPTFSALGYSIGMILVGTKSKWVQLAELSPMPPATTIIVVGGALLGILVLMAHKFADSRIESWSRVRTVIDRPGLMLVPDANRLCSDRASEGGLLLPTGIKVEGLERRVCSKGHVLDVDAPRPADAWSVERVKVLAGSNTGLKGWVLAYGISGDN